MSFDLFYQARRIGTAPARRLNPFTGQVQESPAVERLSARDLRAVLGVLAGAGARGPDVITVRPS